MLKTSTCEVDAEISGNQVNKLSTKSQFCKKNFFDIELQKKNNKMTIQK